VHKAPRPLFMRCPAWINRLARHWGFGRGQRPHASQDAAALWPITRQMARLCNSEQLRGRRPKVYVRWYGQ
jgi:hypothetical protein